MDSRPENREIVTGALPKPVIQFTLNNMGMFEHVSRVLLSSTAQQLRVSVPGFLTTELD